MPSRSHLVRGLAARVDRLKATFDALHAAVRDKVAEVLGQSAAEFVRHVVSVALEPASVLADEYDDRRHPPRDEYEDDDEYGWQPPALTTESHPRLATAVAVGCRVADWCVTRWRSKVWPVAAGLAAGAASYFGGRVTAAVLPAVAALSLAAEAAALTGSLAR